MCAQKMPDLVLNRMSRHIDAHRRTPVHGIFYIISKSTDKHRLSHQDLVLIRRQDQALYSSPFLPSFWSVSLCKISWGITRVVWQILTEPSLESRRYI